MYLFESAFMSGTTPINGRVPFPEFGSETKSWIHLARIQKFVDYQSVDRLEVGRTTWGVSLVLGSVRICRTSLGISVVLQARNEAAIASSKFSSSMFRFSFSNSSFNNFLSLIVGAASCFNQLCLHPNGDTFNFHCSRNLSRMST